MGHEGDTVNLRRTGTVPAILGEMVRLKAVSNLKVQSKKGETMNNAKGIHTHGFFKLGKAPAKKDRRNFKMAALLKVIPKVPSEWDFDTANHKYRVPLPMFGNDVYGDCVIAGRAHQTLRFEAAEQKKAISLTEKNVLREYWKEEGGTGPEYDRGLVVLDRLSVGIHRKGPRVRHVGPQAADDLGVRSEVLRRAVRNRGQ